MDDFNGGHCTSGAYDVEYLMVEPTGRDVRCNNWQCNKELNYRRSNWSNIEEYLISEGRGMKGRSARE